jgi:hypothetical protein
MFWKKEILQINSHTFSMLLSSSCFDLDKEEEEAAAARRSAAANMASLSI